MTNKIKVVGIQNCSFKDEGAKGTLYHCIVEDKHIEGYGVIRFFVFDNKKESYPPIELNHEYSADYYRSASGSYVLRNII